MKWIKDEEIIRDKSPMTKYPVRVLSLSLMELEKDLTFLDIGCGTGSIALQAAEFGLKVTAIDCKEEAVYTTLENFKKRNLEGTVIKGMSPFDLKDEDYNRIFVGGSKGNLKAIVKYIDEHLKKDGICLGNFIIMDNAVEFKHELKEMGFEVEVRTISTSKEDNLGLNKADNPVIIVKGMRKRKKEY